MSSRPIAAFGATLALAASSFTAGAAECIAPARPGGGFDLTCRLVQEMLRARPGERPAAEVQVKYLPGGIGAVAFDRAVTQKLADPEVFIAFSTGSLANLAQGKFGPHGPSDVRWLATLGTEYGVVAVRRDSPLADLPALVAALRKDPARAVFGAGGTVGSQDWIKAALLVKAAGRDHRAMRFVAFEGGGQALAALKGGHVDVFCGDALEAREAVASGELRLIAVLSPHRLRAPLAHVPTAREQGIDVVWPTVRGLYMGPGVSEEARSRWAATFRAVMASPRYEALLAQHGLEPTPLTGPELDAYVHRNVDQLRELARGLHLRVR